MTTTTALLQISDELGHAAWSWRGCNGGRHVERAEAHPAGNFADIQPGDVGVQLGCHGGQRVGDLVYLERGLDGCGDLTGVALLDVEPEEVAGLYASADINGTKRLGSAAFEDIRLDAVALVGQTAGVAAHRIIALDGDFRLSGDRARWARRSKILERAAAAVPFEFRSAARPTELRIHRPVRIDDRAAAQPSYVRPAPTRFADTPWGRLPVEHSAPTGRILSVR